MAAPKVNGGQLDELGRAIAAARLDVVVIGGVAMALHGANAMTFDLDICYRREAAAIAALCRALAPHSPSLRTALLDYQDLLLTENVGLTTDYGRVYLKGTVSGLGEYEQVLHLAEPIEIAGERLMVLGLEGLIRANEAAGRDKDKLHLATLRALRALKDE